LTYGSSWNPKDEDLILLTAEELEGCMDLPDAGLTAEKRCAEASIKHFKVLFDQILFTNGSVSIHPIPSRSAADSESGSQPGAVTAPKRHIAPLRQSWCHSRYGHTATL
jgi:hypothetical protein